MIDYIKLEECIDGGLYKLDARNLRYGIFNKDDRGFIGIRYKFGDEYLDEEEHWDIGGTVKPVEYIGPTKYKTPDILDEDLFLYLKTLKSDNPVDYYEELIFKYGDILDLIKKAKKNVEKFVKTNKQNMSSLNGMVKINYIPPTEFYSLRSKDLMEDAKKNESLLSVISEYIYKQKRSDGVRIKINKKESIK